MIAVDTMAAVPVPHGHSSASRQPRQGQHRSRRGAKESAAGREHAANVAKRPFRPYHSINVPRRSDLEAEFVTKNSMVTTIMLRNIPNRYTQNSLIEEIDGVGFAGKYDFFYLPMDVHNRTNVGYAFINFVTPADASHFLDIFKEYKFVRHTSKKVARVSPAHVQGLLSNLEHFLNRAVTQSRDSQYRPVVFVDGHRREFTEALEELQKRPTTGSMLPKRDEQVPLAGEWPGSGTACKQTLNAKQASLHEVDHLSDRQHAVCIPGVSSWHGNTSNANEAFLDARRAFEDAVSSLLSRDLHSDGKFVPPPPGLWNGPALFEAYGDNFLAGSRTGTPRSTGSSADGRQSYKDDQFAGCQGVPEHEAHTPRTSKQLLGMTFSAQCL